MGNNTNMKAGRELDALVAKKVMELEIVKPKGNFKGDPDVRNIDYWLYFEKGKRRGRKWIEGRHIPFFSTKIGEAWKILEKIGTDGMIIINDDAGHWGCEWVGFQNCRPDVKSPLQTSYFLEDTLWADTVPLAICKAALKEMGDNMPHGGPHVVSGKPIKVKLPRRKKPKGVKK